MNQQEAFIYHTDQKMGSDQYSHKLQSSLSQALDRSLLGRNKEGLQGKNFIATVGFTHVGKSTVARGLQERIPGLVKVETNIIHDIINPVFPELQDDNTIAGKGFWLRQAITDDLRTDLITSLCQEDWWIIHDGANLKREERETRFQIPKQFNYKTALLWLNIPEGVFLERLKEADQETMSRGNPPAWVDLYENIQKSRFQQPTTNEANLLLVFSQNEGIVETTMNALRDF